MTHEPTKTQLVVPDVELSTDAGILLNAVLNFVAHQYPDKASLATASTVLLDAVRIALESAAQSGTLERLPLGEAARVRQALEAGLRAIEQAPDQRVPPKRQSARRRRVHQP